MRSPCSSPARRSAEPLRQALALLLAVATAGDAFAAQSWPETLAAARSRAPIDAGRPAAPPPLSGHAWIAPAREPYEAVLDVRINGVPTEAGVVVLVMPDGTLLLAREDADRLRIAYSEDWLIERGAERMLPIPALVGARVAVDPRLGLLHLDLPAALLKPTALVLRAEDTPQPNEHGLGGFLNYDLVAQRSSLSDLDAGRIQIGLFDGFGIATSEHSFVSGTDPVRLMTALRKDDPEGLTTWRLGDFTSAPGSSGSAVLIGGLQYGTNFSLKPSMIVLPFQRLDGEAALPSTVDVYVNGALRDSSAVPSGPFSMTEIPVVTGAGSVRMVVTDSLGRTYVVEQSFFATGRLLRAGLHEYSWELGLQREDFGIASDHYGREVGITTHRWGINDALTLDARVEALQDQRTGSVGAAWLLGDHGVLLGDLAYGSDDAGRGGRGILGFQGQWGGLGAAFEVRGYEAGFVALGQATGAPPIRSATASGGMSLGPGGSIGVALVDEKVRVGSDTRIANLSWSRQIGALGHVAVSVFKDFATTGREGGALTWTVPLARRTSASASVVYDPLNGTRYTAEAQHSLQREPGIGWRLRADDQGDGVAQLEWQHDYGRMRGGVERFGGLDRYVFGADGSLSWFDRSILAARRIENAFALVRVPGLANVRVYFDGELIGRTNGDGELLVPQLRPYQVNKLRIEADDLPLDARFVRDRALVVPFQGSGVLVEFPVDLRRGATFRLVRADGKPVPAGAVVGAGADTPADPVGEDGFVYLGLKPGPNAIVARWADKACRATVTLPAEGELIPDLGTVTCAEAPASP